MYTSGDNIYQPIRYLTHLQARWITADAVSEAKAKQSCLNVTTWLSCVLNYTFPEFLFNSNTFQSRGKTPFCHLIKRPAWPIDKNNNNSNRLTMGFVSKAFSSLFLCISNNVSNRSSIAFKMLNLRHEMFHFSISAFLFIL